MKHLRISLYTPANPDTAVRAPWGAFAPGCNVLRVEHVSPDGVNRYTAAHQDAEGAPFDDDPRHCVGEQASLTGTFKWVAFELNRVYRLGAQDFCAAFLRALADAPSDPSKPVDITALCERVALSLTNDPFVGGEAVDVVGTKRAVFATSIYVGDAQA